MMSQYTGIDTDIANDENLNFGNKRLDVDGKTVDDKPLAQKYQTL